MKWIYLLALFIFSLTTIPLSAQNYPGKHWQQYQSPEEAGFSSEKLKPLFKALEDYGSEAFIVIQDGKIAVQWGDAHRRFRQASIRKSYLNAVFGIYAEKENWNLDQSLADLNIDDLSPLTKEEKTARIKDLLAARSGVYHPSAYNTRSNAANLPERGSHPPGAFWYYNNWDFNVLLTIFEQKSGKDFFREFQKKIARPLQMEDFRLFDTFYRLEEEVSRHPAYLFKMTARDMGRFGWLILNDGKWKNRQIVPQSWIEKSIRPVTKDLGPRFNNKGSYGWLWWISDGIDGHPMYYASGAGGQRICILPEDQLVVVHLVDTYESRNVSQEKIDHLLSMVLTARTGSAVKDPRLATFVPPKVVYPDGKASDAFVKKIEGDYQHDFLGTFSISKEKEGLIMTAGIGRFHLYYEGENRFVVEDMLTPLVFKEGKGDQTGKVEAIMKKDGRTIDHVIFYYQG